MWKSQNLGAYADVLLLFTRYGRKDFRLSLNTEDFLLPEAEQGEMEPRQFGIMLAIAIAAPQAR